MVHKTLSIIANDTGSIHVVNSPAAPIPHSGAGTLDRVVVVRTRQRRRAGRRLAAGDRKTEQFQHYHNDDEAEEEEKEKEEMAHTRAERNRCGAGRASGFGAPCDRRAPDARSAPPTISRKMVKINVDRHDMNPEES